MRQSRKNNSVLHSQRSVYRFALRLAILALSITAFCGSAAWGQASSSKRGVADSSLQSSTAETSAPGGYFALVIGNDNYTALPKLKTASADASAIAQLLHERYGFTTNVLLNGTRTRILTALNEYRRTLPGDSNLLIYYAGHGHHDPDTDKAYWLPVDAQPDNNDNWISADDITSDVKAIPSQHVLIISDSCYSGVLSRSIEIIQPQERNTFLTKMARSKSRNLMSSGGDEPVLDGGGAGHSIFADTILKSLRQIEEERFTAGELFQRFVQIGVAGRTEQLPQYSPIRNSGHEFGDFVFLRKGVFTAVKTSEPAPTPEISAGSVVPDPATSTGAVTPVSTATVNSAGLSAERQSFSPLPQNPAPSIPTGVQFAVIHYGSIDWTQNCMGWMTVEAGLVHYRAVQGTHGIHSFDFPAQTIKEVKKNSLVGSALQAFHIKLLSGEVYNFSLFDPNSKTLLNSDSVLLAIHQGIGK